MHWGRKGGGTGDQISSKEKGDNRKGISNGVGRQKTPNAN